jgi:acyl-CoA thioesterase I
LLILLEAPYLRVPRIPVPEGGTIYVLGDSLSAGMGMGETPWPELLDGMVPAQVINLARPGAVIAQGIRQAEFLSAEPATVLIALGGNDVMDQTPLTAFRDSLEALMTSLASQGHSLILLETPLYPFQGKYGRAQRELARKHGVILLPKRILTRTLGTPDATLDGLHLSDTGHRHLARQFFERIHIP